MRRDDGKQGRDAFPQSKTNDPLFDEDGICDVLDREGLVVEGTHDLTDVGRKLKGFHQVRDFLEGSGDWVSKLKVGFPLNKLTLDQSL